MATETMYSFTVAQLDSDALTLTIRASTISIALDYINTDGTAVSIYFKDVLGDTDVATLNALMAAYVYVTPAPDNNTIVVSSTPAFAAKTFGTKNLYKRFIGQQYTLAAGANTLVYTSTFTWAKFLGLEVIGGENGDYCSLFVLDTATGTYSGTPNAPLNQFGFTANIAAAFYPHKSQFDADIYAGLQIQMVYHSVSAKTIGVNFDMNEVK